MKDESVLDKTVRVLEKYPLCDRCLGRLFARLSYGHSNAERGKALKLSVLMELHRRYMAGDENVPDLIRRVAINAGPVSRGLFRKLFGSNPDYPSCAICGGVMDRFINDSIPIAERLLSAYDIERFIVGIRVTPSVRVKEDEIKREFNLEYSESIKAELRREIGKKLQETGKFKVDFDNPEATLMVEFPSGAMWLQVNSLLLYGRYWKKGRLISQAYWPTAEGPKYYSIEQALWGLLRATGAERLVLHASGREDVDARMLGTGRPFVLELKNPRKRRIPLRELENIANSGSRYVEVRLERFARRHDIELLKSEESRREKVYKALIVVGRRIVKDDLSGLTSFFNNRLILQRTPRRVLHRRPDILRRRRVKSVGCVQISERVIECLIAAEGGLYIKELVSGDDGRTTPSFSEYLDAEARCVELDVLGVLL